MEIDPNEETRVIHRSDTEQSCIWWAKSRRDKEKGNKAEMKGYELEGCFSCDGENRECEYFTGKE